MQSQLSFTTKPGISFYSLIHNDTPLNKTMNKILFLCLILLTLVACNKQADVSIKDDSKVLATVGEHNITEAYLAAFLSSQGMAQATDQQKAQGLDAVVKQLSLAQLAKKAGLTLTQQQAFEIEQAKHRALAQAAIKLHLAENPITAADIQAEYQRITEALQGEEFHVRHLLFEDEVEALSVLDQIKAGESYKNAEAAYLLVNSQVKNVGDIGWVNIMQVPEVFRAPLQSMQPGTTHPRTLISQYGVHVLYLEDKRPLIAPALETVEAGIRQTLKKQKIDRYQQLAVIKAKAKIVK